MQSLFALQQCREANYKLGLEMISKAFEPDLNSMEVQDKVLLSEKKSAARKLFDKAFQEKLMKVSHEDERIQNVTNEAITFYHKQNKKDSDYILKSTVLEAEKIYNHYITVLCLAKSLVEVAEKDKKIAHTNLVNNAWMKALRSSESLQKDATRLNASWDNKQEYIRVWFRDVVRQDPEYQIYLDKKDPSVEEQKKFTNHLFRRIILGKNSINDYFEEAVLRWTEDKDIVKALVDKTIKSFSPKEEKLLALFTLTVNWEEDREFVEILFKESADLSDELKELISRNTRNWEVDRLPLTDRVILEMAIGELINFSNIPVKVTINEYIELAKNYSTPKSSQFINGILDVIANELKEKGTIKKSGRGLIDNK